MYKLHDSVEDFHLITHVHVHIDKLQLDLGDYSTLRQSYSNVIVNYYISCDLKFDSRRT